MKVTLDRLVTSRVEVEVPDRCPKCGADFTDAEARNLSELQLVGSTQSCYLDAKGSCADGHDGFENSVDPIYATGYSCGECAEVLVDLEEPAPEGGAT